MNAEYEERTFDGQTWIEAYWGSIPCNDFVGSGNTKEEALADLHEKTNAEAVRLRAQYRVSLHTTGPGEGLPDHLIDQAKKFEALLPKCPTCGGSGYVVELIPVGFGDHSDSSPCPDCKP